MVQPRRPTFLGIGAQKAGTSWMHRHLRDHPDIWMPPVKEIHYFDRSTRYPSPDNLAHSFALRRLMSLGPWDRKHPWSGMAHIGRNVLRRDFGKARWWSQWTFGHVDDDWYRNLFSQSESHQECGEFTPAYAILHDEDVQRLKTLNPDIKLIFLIRNPIERAWSALRYRVSKGRVGVQLGSADQIVKALKLPAMVSRGEYDRTLDTYLRHFNSSQLLLGFYDAIQHDPEGLLTGVTDFLAVAPFDSEAIDHKTLVNASPVHTMPDEVREFLVSSYTPLIGNLADRFGSYAGLWADGLSTNPAVQDTSVPRAELAAVLHP